MFEVKKAKRQRRPLKVSLEGLSGSGKTFTALRMAFAMKRAGIGKRIVVADSENESAGLYAGTQIDGETWDFDTVAIPGEMQNPDGYAKCYEFLVQQGFDIIIVDSMTHAWHGAMQQVDDYGARNRGDKFGGWAQVTPQQRHMLATLTDHRAHLIATMRVKSEYERVAGANGKDKIKKVGMKVDQRDGAEYEFDCVARIDPESHTLHIEKVRGCTIMDDKMAAKPGPDFWKPLFDWWLSAEELSPSRNIDAELMACKDSDALRTLFMSLTPEQRRHHAAAKDRRKAELAEGEQSRPPSASSVTGPVAVAGATTSADSVAAQLPATVDVGVDQLPPRPARGPTAKSLSDLLTAVADITGADETHIIGELCRAMDAPDLDSMDAAQRGGADAWLRQRAKMVTA